MASLADILRVAQAQHDTRLSPAEEAAFEAWRSRLPKRLRSTGDYDLRGAWQANAQEAANGHLPDTWKTPNHPTFSSGSMYSSPANPGGDWTDAGNGKWVFWASQANLKNRGARSLSEYFARNEPDSTVVLPISWGLR